MAAPPGGGGANHEGTLAVVLLLAAYEGYATEVAAAAGASRSLWRDEELWGVLARRARSRRDARGALHGAIEALGTERARWLLERCGADPNAQDASGSTPLHGACVLGLAATVALLLSHGADINAVDGEGRTPLHGTVEWTHDAAGVAALLAHGANARATNFVDWTALHFLAWGHDSLDQLPCGNGPHCAAACRKIVAALMAAGVDPNAADRGGSGALGVAAARGHVGAVEALLDAGADIEMADDELYTPLHTACLCGYLDVARALISRGADVHTANIIGRTALGDATDRISDGGDYGAVVALLKAHGAQEPAEGGGGDE